MHCEYLRWQRKGELTPKVIMASSYFNWGLLDQLDEKFGGGIGDAPQYATNMVAERGDAPPGLELNVDQQSTVS